MVFTKQNFIYGRTVPHNVPASYNALLLFNLATDADDPVLGFTTGWVNAFARHFDKIFVITMRKGRLAVAPNVTVYSVGKELGYSEPRRVFEFYRHLLTILKHHHIDACFSHMIPVFSVLAAPVLKAKKIPLMTWYAHRQITMTLKLAHHLSDKMVSINEASYPYRKDKLICTGHGIDTELFSPGDAKDEDPSLILSVGRISPIKNPQVLIDAVEILHKNGQQVKCAFVGDAPEQDKEFFVKIRQYVREKGLDDFVQFVGAVPYRQTVEWYRRCAVHVNCAPSNNAVDKAVLEAMACGKPSLTSAESFRETMGDWVETLFFKAGDAKNLAIKIKCIFEMETIKRRFMCRQLRKAVACMHSLENLVTKLVEVQQSCLGSAD